MALLKNSSQFEETVLSQVCFMIGLTFQTILSYELSASPLWKVVTARWLRWTRPAHAGSFRLYLLMAEFRIVSQRSDALGHAGDKEPRQLLTPTRFWTATALTSPCNFTPVWTCRQWALPLLLHHTSLPQRNLQSRRNWAAESGPTQRPLHIF